MRYEQKAWITVRAASEEDASSLFTIAAIAVEGTGALLSYEDGGPEEVDDEADL